MKTPYEIFLSKWGETHHALTKTSAGTFAGIERTVAFVFPHVYVEAATQHGACAAKMALLDAIVDRNLDLHDLSEFFSPDDIQSTMTDWQEAGMPQGLIPIAKDCGGNLFCFACEDSSAERPQDIPVYFWDHDFNEVSQEASSFNEWLSRYNEIA